MTVRGQDGRAAASGGDPDPVAGEEILGIEAVGVRLGGRAVLDGVTFSIDAGELVGLIGSNGAGKTTLFRVILGLERPTAGQVVVAGRPRQRRNPMIGYVPQKVLLDPDMPMRARDLVGLGVDGHKYGFSRPAPDKRARVEEMLRAVDAFEFADARVGHLSGGEQQRVLIAHALVSQPRLLLLDEPLANLDLRSEQEVVRLLARIAREQGIAVMMSAHDMNPLLPVMDRIVYVARGRVASGTVDEVVRPEVLSGLYGHPVDVIHVHDRILVVAGPGTGTSTARAGATSAPVDVAAGC